jgi:hypothetical protein
MMNIIITIKMKKKNQLLVSLTILLLAFTSCDTNDVSKVSSSSTKETKISQYVVKYTNQQMVNWSNTGSPYLDNEEENSSNTSIDPYLLSQAGVFKPISNSTTRAFGVNPNENRFWSMIRLKIGSIQEPIRSYVIGAIHDIESETNIRFYNAIEDPDVDPVYGFKYPNVHISISPNGMDGSSDVGRIGGEQYIYIPKDIADNPDNYSADEITGFVERALCNVAGMYNEQQRNNRDDYVNIYTNNIDTQNLYHFDKITKNYFSRGDFDWSSITLASSYDFSKNGGKTITTKSGDTMPKNNILSDLDKMFLNYFYLPYKPRTDTYRELDNVVYDGNNKQLTESQRLQLQADLNNGNSTPPSGGELTPPAW